MKKKKIKIAVIMILIQVKKVKKEKEAQKIIKKVNNNKAAKKENHCFYLN